MNQWQKKVHGRLVEISKRPRMYAACREALVALLSGMLDAVIDNFDAQKFYRDTLGTYGATYLKVHDAIEEVNDEWAQGVVTKALAYLT